MSDSTSTTIAEDKWKGSEPIKMDENGIERRSNGTFAKGWKGGPGRNPKRKIDDYITEQDVLDIVEAAKKEAKSGKPQLLETLLAYIFQKPRQNIGLDGGEEGLAIQFSNLFNKNAGTSSTTESSNSLEQKIQDNQGGKA